MYQLIGKTLAHSYSAEIHQAFGRYAYGLKNLPDESALEAFLRADREEWEGLNVTIPYKQAVMPLLSRIDPRAAAIGSVNTVVREADGLAGYNTDYTGFAAAAREAGITFTGKKVLILGTGGTSLTARAVVRDMGAREIRVISRRGEDNYENLERHADAEILINTTPVGMYPQTGPSLVHLRDFPRLSGVIDVIYNPLRTALVLEARDAGIPSAGGLRMLVEQAAAACGLFTGEAPSPELTASVYNSLLFQKTNVVLVGMPGCGKSTTAEALAALTERTVLDTDEEIVRRAGKPIPEIFRESGEDGFRHLESAVIADAGKRTGLILATGGGAVLREENYAPLAQNGRIYFLTRPTDELPTDGRPLSQMTDLEEMYRARLPRYRRFAERETPPAADAEARARLIWEDFCHAYSGTERA